MTAEKSPKKPFQLSYSPALRVAAIYFLISFLWILISDRILENLVADPKKLNQFQTYKGWFFITMTTLILYLLVWNEIRKKERVKKRLVESEQKYRLLFENMNTAFAYCEIIVNESGNPVDYLFHEINPAFEELTGLRHEQVINKTIREIFPSNENYRIETYGLVSLTGQPQKFTAYWKNLDKYFEVSAYSPAKKFFAVTFNDITQKVKTSEEIELYQQQLKNLIIDLFAAEEREKRRLAVNLHDHFSQLLAIAKLRLAEYLRKQESNSSLQPILESKTYIEEALEKTRAMTYELCPPILYELGLISAIEWLINTIREHNCLEIRFYKKTTDIPASTDVQIIIYRVLNEMMNNIIKHAQAKTAFIYIEQMNNLFCLRVIDDGVGFDPGIKDQMKNSFGLFSIRERIESLQGSFQIVTAPGKGTTIDIAIPTT